MDKKIILKRIRYFIYIIIIVSFLVIYFASESGYFDEIKSKNVVLTNEQIVKFENDIKEGKEINIEEYYQNKNEYDNKFSKLGSFLSTRIGETISNILDKTFETLNDFLND